MPETLPKLRRKIKGAHDLQSVVRTMKAMAAANITPYEQAVEALATYSQSVELALAVLLRQTPVAPVDPPRKACPRVGAVVFGTDQGMIGQFNEQLAQFASKSLAPESPMWVVGERMQVRVRARGRNILGTFPTPNSVAGITPLVSSLLLSIEEQRQHGVLDEVFVIHNQPYRRASYTPVTKRLLPLDATWRHNISSITWPTRVLPEIMYGDEHTLEALVREYLFVSIFRAAAESLAAENAHRFRAMQGAEKNIGDLLNSLNLTYNQRRQAAIDEELFDLVAGYAVLEENPGLRLISPQ